MPFAPGGGNVIPLGSGNGMPPGGGKGRPLGRFGRLGIGGGTPPRPAGAVCHFVSLMF